MLAFTYHEDFNKYDLGIDHPLIGDKPRKIIDFFQEKSILKQCTVFSPKKATEADLLRVHDKTYVDHVKQLSKTGGLLAADTPAPKGIYDIARLATGGSMLAGEKLFESYEIAVNPLGGFHHASKNHSSGFCFFNDIAITIEYLRHKYNVKRFEIIDVDVHHGNGTQDIFFQDPSVLNISFHQDGRTLYPETGEVDTIGGNEGLGTTVNLPLPPGTGGKSYLWAFDEIVPTLTKQFNPEVILYQSGVDTHHADPLADLNLTYQTYYQLAKQVKELSEQTCKKLVVLFGGGYNNETCIHSYYDIMCGLVGREDIFVEEDIPDQHQEEVERLVSELKEFLWRHWCF